jgi:PAS domain S-box-containing protein
MVEEQTELICRWQPDGTLTFVNEAYSRYFARSRESLIGQRFTPLIPAADRPEVRAHMASLGPERPIAACEHRVVRGDGQVRWQRWIDRALFDEAGNMVEFQSVGRDVTERRRAQALIREQRDLLQAAIDALNHPFCVIEVDDHSVVMANAAARQGRDPAQAKTCYALNHDRDRPCSNADQPCPLPEVVRTGQPQQMEHVQRDADGALRYFEVHGYPLLDAEGRVRRMIEYSLDVTERRLAEEAQREAVAVAEREHLARELHDAVTQVLFSASLVAEVLPQVWDRSPEEALEGVAELRNLTRGALAETRTLLLELRPAALVESKLDGLLLQLTEAITGRTEIEVSMEVEPVPQLPSDVHLAFYRIAQESLYNVVKHSRAQKVTLSLRVSGPSFRTASSINKRIELCICDDGRGFEPALSHNGQLGLRIMHERAEAVGARLCIDSAPGQGTQVTLTWQRGAS